MKSKAALIVAVLVTAALLIIGTIYLKNTTTGNDETQPQQEATASSPASSSETPRELSGGAQGGHQAPTEDTPNPLPTSVTPEDEKRAKATAERVITLYGAGGTHETWMQDIAPHLTPQAQATFKDFDPEPARLKVTGSPKIIDDPSITEGNPYWVRVSVPTDHDAWTVKLRRSGSRPDTWKADTIEPASVYAKGATE